MLYRLAIAFVLTGTLNSLSAQSDQYVVKLNGDTIRGKLQINPARDNSRSMYFKHEDGSKENIRPIRISYVYYSDEYQFRSVPFYNQRLFMQIQKEDRNLSYYNYIHKRDNSIATTKVIVKPNGETLELSAITFRKQITDFMKDCPKVIAKLDAKLYRYKDHVQLFEDYNDCDTQIAVANASNSPQTAGQPAVPAVDSNTDVPTPPDPHTDPRFSKIDEFRKYVRSLTDFQYSRDVLEWLTDVEYRVSQDRDIPNYLWNSLNAMTTGNQELEDKANILKQELGN
ncbi:MAG: hypothetical protein DHS20C17_07500 [Cyclobacteriaceae bacterium]|nr:MAG: hypothetical protein DHS20C17_07500 [Cyclobacteriaceae bacterium]